MDDVSGDARVFEVNRGQVMQRFQVDDVSEVDATVAEANHGQLLQRFQVDDVSSDARCAESKSWSNSAAISGGRCFQ